MLDVLPIPLPWYVVGLLLGLTVAGFYAVTNEHLGISGAYVQVVDFARGRQIEAWRLWLPLSSDIPRLAWATARSASTSPCPR